MENKFHQLAGRIHNLQATHIKLPSEVYIELQDLMFELRSIEPLEIKEITELVKNIDNTKKPVSELIIELLRAVEQKHGIT